MRLKTPRVTDAMRSPNKPTAARAYVAQGFKLVMAHGIDKGGRCTCRDKGCSHPGKHPISEFFPRGAHSATADLDLVKRSLEKYPDANIGGVLHGWTGVDVDGPEGETQINALNLPPTATIITGRGHDHIFAGELPGGTAKATQLDILSGAQRYIILPPSVHANGDRYRWSRGLYEIAPLPERLVEFALELKGSHRREERSASPELREGQRNERLFRIACAYRRSIKDESLVLEMVQDFNRRFAKPPLPEREIETLVASSGNYHQRGTAVFGPPATIEPLPMEFLWHPYIIKHGITLLVGDPGRGKSLFAEYIAALVSRGGKLPLSEERIEPGRVLFLSAEDDWARTTLARLLRAGADIKNFHVMDRFRALDEQNMLALKQEIESWKPDLVVVDTLATFLGGERDMHRQNDVQEFLSDLTYAARDTGSAILAIAHMNKQTGEDPIYRINGSIGFAAGVRSINYLGRDPDDPNRIALAHGKSNVAGKGQTHLFEKRGGGRNDVPVLEAVGTSEYDEVEVCRNEKRPVGRPPVEKDRAAEFIIDALSAKPIPWSDVSTRARRAGITEGTLDLVRAELAKEGAIVQVGKGPKARWRRRQ
jgi:hypothetical protein